MAVVPPGAIPHIVGTGTKVGQYTVGWYWVRFPISPEIDLQPVICMDETLAPVMCVDTSLVASAPLDTMLAPAAEDSFVLTSADE